ncbi:hypothetical protein [Rufibacter latericius]|uniref:DUF4968 domain-containing protein n=1 Tax=Rufibacter latericius TaxID=2487040 RepID=A0A3M9MMD6_9BACT|nr:hypothetical protein [Rufibacter latericius]RNI26033.1 hypothetical protein EFB08_14485 [Rufibacter latericius]
MKNRHLSGLLLIAFLFLFSGRVGAQNVTNAVLSKEGTLTLMVEKTAFQVILSLEGKIISYAIKADGDISYDLHGRLKQVGYVEISYDIHDRINKIASEEFSYDLHGRLSKIGKTEINYHFVSGKIERIKG